MKIIVNAHKCEIDKTPVNEKEINITKCEFEFAEEITNEFVKEAYFTLGKGETYKQIIVDNECDIPGEVLEKKSDITIGVVAYLVENNTTIKRYNPSPAYFNTWEGSLRDAENSQPITPSEMEQYEQALQDGLSEVNQKLVDIDEAIEDVNEAITETNNLNLDVDKQGKVATVTLTKKDASTKVVTLSDGTSLMFNWDGTKLGIKTDEDAEYTYVDLQGIQGVPGPKGDAFQIKKTYTSVAEMNADFNNMQLGDYVMIASTVEVEDNAKLYTRGEEQWIFISDFSGATGIRGETGLTPNIQIGTVVSGETPSVTRTGTNENPVLNFTLVKGDTGPTGPTGETGATGNGIASIIKTSSEGLVDTYTITYTDGTTSTFNITNGEDGETPLSEFNALKERVEDLEDNQITLPSEGTNIHVEDAAKARLYEFEFEKESSQDGEPTPDYPQEVKTVEGYKNEITFDNLTDETTLNVNKYFNNGEIKLNGTTNNSGTFISSTSLNITLPAGTYTLSYRIKEGTYTIPDQYADIGFNLRDSSATIKNQSLNGLNTNGTPSSTEFTLEEDTVLYFSSYCNRAGIVLDNLVLQVQIIEGTEELPYVPYGNNYIAVNISDGTNTNSVPLPLNGNEIVGIGNYLDEYIVDKSGHCWLNKLTGKKVFDGTEYFMNMGWSNKNGYRTGDIFENMKITTTNSDGPYIVCNYFTSYTQNGVFGIETGFGISNRTNHNAVIIRYDEITTVDDLKTWLSSHNTEVYYVLETPELIDLQTTVDIKLFKGVNNISNSEDGNMRIRYVESIESIINDFDTRLKALEQGESL